MKPDPHKRAGRILSVLELDFNSGAGAAVLLTRWETSFLSDSPDESVIVVQGENNNN